MQKINGISGLRGVIACIIVGYHLQQIRPIAYLEEWNWDLYQFFNMLPVVVSVFFILGGLLRSLAYWNHIFYATPKPNTKKILLDRWFRIAPTYYIVLIISMMVAIALGAEHIMDPDFWISSISGLFFLNWLTPSTFFPSSINGPLWFVAYDMMGYIFTIFMMIGLTKVKKNSIYKTIFAYIILFLGFHFLFISIPWNLGSGIVSAWFPYYNPFIFGLYYLMGIIIGGVITRYPKIRYPILGDIGFLIVLFGLTYFLWNIRGAPDLAYSFPVSPYRFPLVPGLLAFALVSLIYSKYLGIIMDNRLFLFLSSISYSLYLWHGLVLYILHTMVFHHISESNIEWILLSGLTLILSISIATLSARYIEGWRRR